MFHGGELISKLKEIDLSIIIPTYNESENILNLIDAVKCNLPDNINAEVIIVDDNSPDGTGTIVEDYIRNCENSGSSGRSHLSSSDNFENFAIDDFESRIFRLRVVHRKNKFGLIPAIPSRNYPHIDTRTNPRSRFDCSSFALHAWKFD